MPETPIEWWEYADAPGGPPPGPRIGKWLLFTSPPYQDEVWAKIKMATEAGRLGCSAKTVAPSAPGYGQLKGILTCVYTFDYDNHDDVRRVLGELRRLGWKTTLSYKTDEATLRGHYGDGVSIYVSKAGSLDFEDRRAS